MTEERRKRVQSLSKDVKVASSGNKRKNTKTKNVKLLTDDYEELAIQYDEQAKIALGYKSILAFILAKAVDEFSEMETKDIIDLIEDVYIGKVPVDSGHTNVRKGERIYGLNTENSERNEGLIRYDILFKVRTSKNAKDAYVIIVNIEMQKEEPKGYNLVNRAIYYACRLISSEKQREFVKMNFNDIVKVYSIWIVANMEDNSVNRIHFTQDTLYGSHKWNCDTDLINIIIIGITGQPDVIENNVSKENLKSLELCKMLNTLFSNDFKNKERYDRLEKEFNIYVDDNLKEAVEEMCNLGQGILERALKEGRQKGRQEGRQEVMKELVIEMYKDGDSIAKISRIAKIQENEIRQILVDNDVMLY